MKKLILSFYFLLSTCYLFSQEPFNVVFPNEQSPSARNIMILQDTGYATIGGAIINDRGISVTITDINGNNINSLFYSKIGWSLYHGAENNFTKGDDGNYFLSGTAVRLTGNVYDPVDSSYVYLLKMDENFDSLITYTFLHDTLNIATYGMALTNDKGFLIVGNARRKTNGSLVYENSYDAFMLKIDSLGQEEWYKTFGRNTSGNDEDEFYKVVQTPDNGYLCVGYTKSWQTAPTVWDRGDWWLVKTDSLGNEQWNRRYGHPDYDDGRPYGLIMSSDTSYYIVGNRVISQNGNDLEASALLKLNSNFQNEFLKLYNKPSYTDIGFTAIIENNQGDLILGGTYRLHDEINENGLLGQLFKINSDGDSIWKRYYTCLDTTNTLNIPFSIKQTSDGGYIFTGIAYDNDLSPAQQVWLVKTDEYGCDGTDWWTCATDVQIHEYASNPEFYVYPNPVTEGNDVQCVIGNVQLSSLRADAKQSIDVYNLTGELVKQVQIQDSNQKIQVNDLESGVYFIKVGEQIQKLIIDNQ